MEYEDKCCQITDVSGHIENGKQFDLDITLPEDHRNVIYGVVKNLSNLQLDYSNESLMLSTLCLLDKTQVSFHY